MGIFTGLQLDCFDFVINKIFKAGRTEEKTHLSRLLSNKI